MSGPIFFNVRQARERLLSTGEVLTLRKRRGTGYTVAYTGNRLERARLCRVLVEFGAPYRGLEDTPLLETNLEGSGFATVAEWLFHASDEANVLYRVKRVGP